ncbi:PKD domain-containing protein [Paenibacillus rigui]|nr:PKD domain-containing protein [Paenibacillus rigui]
MNRNRKRKASGFKNKAWIIAALSLLILPQTSYAFDYSSYKGLQLVNPSMIPPESKTSDQDKKIDGLQSKLSDPAVLLGALPKMEAHPSLWFTADKLPEYQARRLVKGSYYEQLWMQLNTTIDSTYGQLDYADPKLHENDRSRGAKLLAFAYMMVKDDPQTSDERKHRLLRQAIAAITHMYTGTVAERTKDDGDIYWATYLQNYAEAYDWLYSELSAGEEQEARGRLKKEAQFIADWLITPQPPRPHNHRSKPALGLGTVALTLSQEPEAQYWLNLAIERTYNTFDFQFSADGISREGAHYGQFTLVNLIPFLWHYKNTVGFDAPDELSPQHLINQVQPLFEWAVKTRMGNGWLPNTEDSYVKPYATHMAAGLYKSTPAPQYGKELKLSEVLQWSYKNTHIYLPDYTGATSQYQIGIDEYLTYDAAIEAKRPTVSRTMFMNGGMNPDTGKPYGGNAILGNQWNGKEEEGGQNTLWLMLNGTPESDNHQHQDQLQFDIYGQNALFATDTGYGQYSAFNSYLKTPAAHNLITMNGRSTRNETDPYQPLRSAYEIDTAHFDFAQKEGDFVADDKSVIGTHRRAVAFPGQQYFVVADQVSSRAGSASFDMYLHSLGALRLNGNHAEWSITKAMNPELTEKPPGDKEASVPNYGLQEAKLDTFIFPSNVPVQPKDGVISLFKEDIRDTYIRVPAQTDHAQYLTVLVPQQLDQPAPSVQDLSTDSYTAARIRIGPSEDTYLLHDQKETKSVAAGHLRSDAGFAWLRETNGQVTDLMLREGQMASVQGKALVQSSVPVTLTQQITASEIHGTVSDLQDSAELSIGIPSGRQVVSVSSQEGNAIPFTVVSGQVQFKQSVSGAYRIALAESGVSALPTADHPAAAFTADALSGYGARGTAERKVQFDAAASSGQQLTYSWSFGDGTSAEGLHPEKTYRTFGTFLVNLTITDEKGRTDSKTMLVDNKDPNQAPVAAFTTDVSVGRPPLTVHLNAADSYDPDSSLGDRVRTYSWNFGDGSPVLAGEDKLQAEHTYEKAGSYTITLTVTDELGKESQTTTSIEAGSAYGYFVADLKQPEDENVYVLLEAEQITYNSSTGDDQISIVPDPKASGGAYVKVGSQVPDATSSKILDSAYKDTLPANKIPEGTPYVEYEFKVKHAGAYQVHLFSQGASTTTAGSLFIQFDGSDLKRVTLKDNDWKRAFDNTQFNLDEGTHVLRVYSRKGGADWDRVLLTTDGITHTKVQSTLIPVLEPSHPVPPPEVQS